MSKSIHYHSPQLKPLRFENNNSCQDHLQSNSCFYSRSTNMGVNQISQNLNDSNSFVNKRVPKFTSGYNNSIHQQNTNNGDLKASLVGRGSPVICRNKDFPENVKTLSNLNSTTGQGQENPHKCTPINSAQEKYNSSLSPTNWTRVPRPKDTSHSSIRAPRGFVSPSPIRNSTVVRDTSPVYLPSVRSTVNQQSPSTVPYTEGHRQHHFYPPPLAKPFAQATKVETRQSSPRVQIKSPANRTHLVSSGLTQNYLRAQKSIRSPETRPNNTTSTSIDPRNRHLTGASRTPSPFPYTSALYSPSLRLYSPRQNDRSKRSHCVMRQQPLLRHHEAPNMNSSVAGMPRDYRPFEMSYHCMTSPKVSSHCTRSTSPNELSRSSPVPSPAQSPILQPTPIISKSPQTVELNEVPSLSKSPILPGIVSRMAQGRIAKNKGRTQSLPPRETYFNFPHNITLTASDLNCPSISPLYQMEIELVNKLNLNFERPNLTTENRSSTKRKAPRTYSPTLLHFLHKPRTYNNNFTYPNFDRNQMSEKNLFTRFFDNLKVSLGLASQTEENVQSDTPASTPVSTPMGENRMKTPQHSHAKLEEYLPTKTTEHTSPVQTSTVATPISAPALGASDWTPTPAHKNAPITDKQVEKNTLPITVSPPVKDSVAVRPPEIPPLKFSMGSQSKRQKELKKLDPGPLPKTQKRFSWRLARTLIKNRVMAAESFKINSLSWDTWDWIKIPTLGASPTSCRVQEMYKATIHANKNFPQKKVFIKCIPISTWKKQWQMQNFWHGEYVTDGENFVMEAAVLAFLSEFSPGIAPDLLGIVEASRTPQAKKSDNDSHPAPSGGETRFDPVQGKSSRVSVSHIAIISELYGEDLLDYLDAMERDKTPLTSDQKRKLQYNCLLLLHKMHSLGFAHLDFTPENILHGSEGLRVCDFAKSTPLWSSRYRHLATSARATNLSPFESCEPTIGKGAYMPPECWRVYYRLEDSKIQCPLEELWAVTKPEERRPFYFKVREADVYMTGVLLFWVWSDGGIWKCSDPRQDEKYHKLVQSGIEFNLFRECRSWPDNLKSMLASALQPEVWKRTSLTEMLRHSWFSSNLYGEPLAS
eukprot:GHVP01031236.1.p1 GENE.GHVP01031236.1~~GHVP01031236.1.p1  ORF type:complete len:1097 (+),score=151.32 GHVP01031236.1:1047-4337(+)